MSAASGTDISRFRSPVIPQADWDRFVRELDEWERATYAGLVAGVKKRNGKKRRLHAYNPDEPRDEKGEWTAGDIGPRPQPEGGWSPEDFVRDSEWKNKIRQAISEGKLSVKDAEGYGYIPFGAEAKDEWNKTSGWRPLPSDLYHVTTAKTAVMREGLKSRAELGQHNGRGLGGGDDDTISFTDDPAAAENIYHTLHEARKVASGEISLADLVKAAREGRGAHKPYPLEEYFSPGWKPGDPEPPNMTAKLAGMTIHSVLGKKLSELPPGAKFVGSTWKGGDGIERGNLYQIPATEREQRDARMDAYKYMLAMREYAGGPENPLFFSSDDEALGRTPADEIAVVHVKPVAGGMGYQMGALGEWRTHSGKAVRVIGTETPKPRILATFNPDEPRDDKGEWTTGGFSEPPKTLDDMYARAPAAKEEIDRIGQALADKFGGRLLAAPLKGRARAEEKIAKDYKGDATRIKDLARNTVVLKSQHDVDLATAELRSIRPDAVVKQTSAADDPLGYSGVIASVPAKSGIRAEIQINTAAMIIAKEPEPVLHSMFDGTMDRVKTTLASHNLSPGYGHRLYEAWRAGGWTVNVRNSVARKSRQYYRAMRAADISL